MNEKILAGRYVLVEQIGIGGMAMAIGKVTLTAIACALILGIIVNLVVSKAKEN